MVYRNVQEAVISWELSAVLGPHQEFHPGGQQNYIACGRQTLFMTDTVSTSPFLADSTLILFRAAVNSVPSETLTFSDILVSRGSHVTCFWQ